MIIVEKIDNRVKHYSDKNVMLLQKETGKIYVDAVDVIPCKYTYEETDTPIENEEISEDFLTTTLENT